MGKMAITSLSLYQIFRLEDDISHSLAWHREQFLVRQRQEREEQQRELQQSLSNLYHSMHHLDGNGEAVEMQPILQLQQQQQHYSDE